MKKTTKPNRRKTAGKKIGHHHHHRRLLIIPWAMCALAIFYLASLAAIIRIYPEAFVVSESHAQIQTTSLQRMTNIPGTTATLQTETPKTIGTDVKSTDTSSMTDQNTLSASPTQSDTTQTTKSPNTPTIAPTSNTATDSVDSPTISDKTENINISPTLRFLNPADGAAIKNQQIFQASVEAAQGVEFHIRKSGSLTEQFLCNGKNSDQNKWVCEVQTKNIPNGEYKLLARIKNNYGSYKSSAITIKVANETALTSFSATNPEDMTTVKSQTAKATAQEVQKVQENVEKRSREQNTQNEAAGKATSANATVAGSLSKQLDTDRDGVSNEEEKRIGTDPNSADTDKDGYMDGDEIKNGFNPLKSSAGGDKIVFESPKEKGEVKKELVQIKSVEIVANSAQETEKYIQLKGKALSLSFVTIYIYSETPTIVTVMTNENGNWTYTMDKSIENGHHEAYVAVTDNEGRITVKSEPFLFVKTAEAATVLSGQEAALQNASATASPVAASRSKQVAVIGFVIILSLFTLIACIGLFLAYQYHHKKMKSVVKKDFLETK